MKKPNTSIVAVMRYATFALALAGTLSVFADRKWTAGGGNDTDWTNDANWDSGTGTRLFNQQNWTATDNTINVSFTNRTTESGNAFFIQSKTDTVVFNAASDEAGLDITVPNSGNWWVQNFYVGTDAQDGAWVVNGGTYSIGGGSLYIGHNGNNKAATGSVTIENGSLTLGNALLVGAGGAGSLEVKDGKLAINGVLDVANAGTGTFAMSNGTVTASKYMRLGFGANSIANVYISGGELTAGGSTDNSKYYGLMLADSASSAATFTIDGGTATFIHDSNIGWNGSGTLNIGGTGKLSVGTATDNKWLFMNRQSAATGKSTINLSGSGILDICHVELDHGTGEINFDGGAIHAYANNGNCGGVVIAASDNLTVNVKAGGATFDVPSGVAVSIAEPLLEDATSTGGGLTKTGRGVLTLAGSDTYTGTTTVEGGVLRLGASTTYASAAVNRGVLSFAAGQAFSGAVTIAKGGALAIDVSSAVDASTVAVGNTITLLSATSLTLAEGDSLEEVVFLGGPAIEYTLAFENGALVATVTDVSHASSTRKVTAFIAEDGTIDQDYNWSNGMPANASYDTIIFCNNATMSVWAETWGDGNNRACQTMAIRDATVLAQQFDNWNPKLDKNRIVGNGTLQLRRLGLERVNAPETTVTVGENITIEIVQTASNTDTWIASCTINGDLRVTTGYTIFHSDITVNGNATFTGEGKDSYVTDKGTNTGNTFNGDFIMEGGNFNFNSAAVTFGPNARLVLAGGTVSNYGNNIGMTNVVVNGGLYNYTALPGVGGADFHCSLEDGGTIEIVAAADGTITATGLVANGGKVVIDAAAMSLSEGSTINLSQISLATGAAFGTDVEVQIAGTAFDWTISGTTATATTPADAANRWLGGESGTWFTAKNWKYGVPTLGQTVVFDTNAVVTLSANANVGTLSNANSTVQFRTSNVNNTHPTIFVSEKVSGKGTFQFYHAGIISATSNKDCPVGGGEDDDLTLEVLACSSDSWFEGSNSSGPLAIYAKMKSEGKIVFRRDVRLYGDNSGCTGAIECNGTSGKMYFANTNAGSANATWSFSGDVYLGATATDENFTGTISFGTLNTSGTATLKVNTAVSGVVIEVGAGTWGNQYFLVGQDFSTGNNADVVTKDVTLKKVGTGTLTYNGFGIPKIEVAEGVFSLGTPNTSLTHYSHTYTTIDSLTVAEGAVLTGSGTRTVTNTTLESGAILRQSIAASGNTYTCPTLTIYGSVNVTDAVCELVDADDYLANAQATDTLPTFTLLSATSVTGTPTGAIDMATDGWAWMPKVKSGTQVVMSGRCKKPGFILTIR